MAFVSNRVCTSPRSIPFIFTIKLKQLLGGSRSTSAFVILLQGKTMSLSELKHLFLIKRVSHLINFPFSNTRGMESYWFLHFLHVSTTRKIIEKLARINEVSSRAVQPIPWKCEVFLWEQAFNFVPAEDREAEQIGLRLEVGVGGGGGGPRVEEAESRARWSQRCTCMSWARNVSASPQELWGERKVEKGGEVWRGADESRDTTTPPTLHPSTPPPQAYCWGGIDSNRWLN